MLRTRWFLTLLAVALALMAAGCKSEKARLEEAFAAAGGGAGGAGGRAAAANALRIAWGAGKIRITEAVNLANAKLDESGGAGAPGAVAFAAAVLDTIDMIEPDIERANVNELFWIQVGTLAGKAGAVALNAGDAPLARSVVLAGSTRWQTDAYWERHRGHDAVASLALHRVGESREALARLRSRPDLDEETQAAYDVIERDWRRSKGG